MSPTKLQLAQRALHPHPITVARLKLGMTQRQLARKADLSLRLFTYIESHNYQPKLCTQRCILQALGLPNEEPLAGWFPPATKVISD